MSSLDELDVVLVAVNEDPVAPDVLTVVAYRADDLDLVEKQFPGQGQVLRIVNNRVLSAAVHRQVRDLLAEGASCWPDGRYGICVGRFSRPGGWWDPVSLRAFKVVPEPFPDSDRGVGDDGVG